MSKTEQERLEFLFYDDYYDNGEILYDPNNNQSIITLNVEPDHLIGRMISL